MVMLLLLVLLLSACAGETEAARPALPESCRVVYRMESYEAGERTSHQVLTVVQNEQGVYYRAAGGEEYLFLEASPESYTMYIRSQADGTFTVSPGEIVGREKVERFAEGVLHVGLLTWNTDGLAAAGTDYAAGRECVVYEGQRPAGAEYDLHARLLVDRETGLVLGHWLRYTHRGTGAETLYVMRCELFEVGVEALPVFFPL